MSVYNNSQFNTSSQNKSNINSNTFNSNTIEKSFSDVNYEVKIQSLNGNVFKLNERLEKKHEEDGSPGKGIVVY